MPASPDSDIYRPATLAELSAQASDFAWDPSKPAAYWVDFAREALRTSREYEAMGELELAYIEHARAVSVFLERLPVLEDIDEVRENVDTVGGLPDQLLEKMRDDGEQMVPDMLQDLERLDDLLRTRREEWESQHGQLERTHLRTLPPHASEHEPYNVDCTCAQCLGLLADSPGSSGLGHTWIMRRPPSPSAWAGQEGGEDGEFMDRSYRRRSPNPSLWADQEGGEEGELSGMPYQRRSLTHHLRADQEGLAEDEWDEEVIAHVMRASMVQPGNGGDGGGSSSRPSGSNFRFGPTPPAGEPPKKQESSSEKTPSDSRGLCVVCQDMDAVMAVVDCGHLCMCMDCCRQIMEETKECPLCRTSIAGEWRLLRIYKT